MLTYNKILVPVDFTQISHSAILKAANHSEVSNSELLIAHILEKTNLGENEKQQLIARAERKLDDLLDGLEIGYCEKLVEAGDTVENLLNIIKDRNIDLVVMGTHSGMPLSPFIRSMSVEVVTRTQCDVLVLHR